ncbi:MAG TPA: hypothetical protein VJA20_04510 [Candidatus Nanoarchaeia archaeon]|nr:hypothetical protein [Candidatus Nanoarchaeia archaeon]
MEVPKEIRYEFFLILIGIIFLIFPLWLYFFKQEIFQIVSHNLLASIGLTLFSAVGATLFLYGARELADNYNMDKDLFIREYILKKYKLDSELKKLPKEYTKEIKLPEKNKK